MECIVFLIWEAGIIEKRPLLELCFPTGMLYQRQQIKLPNFNKEEIKVLNKEIPLQILGFIQLHLIQP